MKFNQMNNNLGDVNNTINQQQSKTLFDHFCSWYGAVGSTATIVFGLLGWYAGHVQFNWWFFGL